MKNIIIPLLIFSINLIAGPMRPGLETIAKESRSSISAEEQLFLQKIADPLIEGKDVSKALDYWFKGREFLAANNQASATQAWLDGIKALEVKLNTLPPVPLHQVQSTRIKFIKKLKINYPDVTCQIVSWKANGLTQYGVYLKPVKINSPIPLLIYCHGAAFGVPTYSLGNLAQTANYGYAVLAPALRGEPLFVGRKSSIPEFNPKSEGEIENLDGEVIDIISAAQAMRDLPEIADGKYALAGHSFGGGAALLAATQSKDVACCISYDAWLTNPFRYTWDRMRRSANNWLSWEYFCNQPAKDVLTGLARRSVILQSKQIECPLLMFIGMSYQGSVFHQSHDDFIKALTKYDKKFTYVKVPNAGHNFVLYYNSKTTKNAYKQHMDFLQKHLPPATK